MTGHSLVRVGSFPAGRWYPRSTSARPDRTTTVRLRFRPATWAAALSLAAALTYGLLTSTVAPSPSSGLSDLPVPSGQAQAAPAPPPSSR